MVYVKFTLVLLVNFGLCSLSAAYPESKSESVKLDQLIPDAELTKIRNALPKVSFALLQNVLDSDQTLWYTDEVMQPSYQDSVGAASNRTWPDLIAVSEAVKRTFFDRQRKRWLVPFGTTAGADDVKDMKVVNFVYLPGKDGRIETIKISKVIRNSNRYQWTWKYPIGTVFGEILFVKDEGKLLPTEIRTRKRYASGWATNVFRPFPTAESLAEAIKHRRPDFASDDNLLAIVEHLENPSTLTPKILAGQKVFASVFRQEGWIDTLPPFKDKQLVRDLLSSTRFVSTYDKPWKQDGHRVAYAANSKSGLSIVPNNYDAGLLQVTDEACRRCHQETGRMVSEFNRSLELYGELWGKDGIFSFHPYDESRYPYLRRVGNGPGGMTDNRRINPALSQMNVFAMAKAEHSFEDDFNEGLDETDSILDIPKGASVTYRDHIKPIMDRHCAECHALGPRAIDFTEFPFRSKGNLDQESIVSIVLARAGGAAPSMPPGVRPSLSAQELALIEAWQEGGLQP